MSDRIRIPKTDRRQPRTRRAPDRKRKAPAGLRATLAEIATEHPDLAEAIHEVVTMIPNTREGGRWY